MFLFKEEHQWSSDGTDILDPTPTDVDEDTRVSDLRRTDSVVVSLFATVMVLCMIDADIGG